MIIKKYTWKLIQDAKGSFIEYLDLKGKFICRQPITLISQEESDSIMYNLNY